MKLAVMLPNWVGDACMATPTLRALRSELPSDTSICWVGRPAPLGVLEGLPWADKTLCYKPRSKTLLNRRRLIAALKHERFDAIVYLTNSLSSAVIGAMAGIRRRVGYSRDYRGWLLTDPIPVCSGQLNARKDPCIDNYLRLARALGCQALDRRTELAVTHDDQTLAESSLESIGFDHHRDLIVLNTGAATTLTKRWPIEQAALAASKLAQDLDVWVLIHCGPAERDNASSIETLAKDPRVKSMGRFADLPLGLSKSLIARSKLVVSTDSGPRHIAVALNKPVVSLFGSIDPSLTRTYNVPETIVTLGLDCQPCGSYDCRFKHANCMNQLDAHRVVHAAKTLLGQPNNPSPALVNLE